MTADPIYLEHETTVVDCFLTQDQTIKPTLENRTYHSVVSIPVVSINEDQ
jgi:hypothetical protein